MSQLDTTFDDVDADLDALLNQDEAMEDAPASQPPSKTVDAPAATTEAFKDTTLPEATDKAEAADAAAPAAAPKAHQVTADDTQEPAKPASGGPAKPAIGSKKRQLTVPSVTMPPGGKRPTLKVLQASTAPAKPATMSSIAPPTAAPSEPMSTTTAAAPAESEASSPAKPPKPASPAAAKPAEHSGAAAEKDEAAAAADVTCCLGELTEQLAGAASDAEEADEQGGEGEATSPKKAAAPAATAAPAAPAALARKKKALTVAPAPTAGASAAASSTPAAAKAIKPSKSEKEKKMKAAPKKAPAAAAGEAEDPVGKLPTAKSAYMLFADDKRTQVKADHPELSFGEVGRKLGELWKALNEEDRKAYNDRAGAEKARVAAEIAAMDQGLVAQLKAAKGSKKGKKDAKAAAAAEEAEQAPAAPAAKKEETSEKQTEKDAAKAEKKAEKAAAKKAEKDKAAWESGGKKMHHRQLFVPTRMQHPGADIAQINAIISQAWVALTAEERTQFSKQAAEEAEADKALKRAPKAAASEAGSSKAASRPGKRGRKAAASGDGQESSGEETAADNGEESDREDVDWGEHPAAGVLRTAQQRRPAAADGAARPLRAGRLWHCRCAPGQAGTHRGWCCRSACVTRDGGGV
ncbi:hypothetical protein COO60DRAFT_311398 [Scenedesmus sp. NREL 46B-D3]|nr:hypothetical protein COO60DRAFT_311398 [Scenedesmus sp. NREL 46B-D3]